MEKVMQKQHKLYEDEMRKWHRERLKSAKRALLIANVALGIAISSLIFVIFINGY